MKVKMKMLVVFNVIAVGINGLYSIPMTIIARKKLLDIGGGIGCHYEYVRVSTHCTQNFLS